MSFGPFETQKSGSGRTCMVTFRIFLPSSIAPEPRLIYVYGSWNGYRVPSRLERDSRSGPGIWKDQIPASGLIQGQSYGYYYLLDNRTPWYDPSARLCVDADINETVMVLEVPILLPDDVSSPAASTSAVSPQCQNPHAVSQTSQQRTKPQAPATSGPSTRSLRQNPLKIKVDSPTVRFDPSLDVPSPHNPQSNFRSLPSRNLKKRKSIVGLFSMGSNASVSTDNLHKTISLKKSWMSIFKSRRNVSHSDIKVTVTRPAQPVRRHTEDPPRVTEKPIGLGITIPTAPRASTVQVVPPKPSSTQATKHVRRPSIPDEWRASIHGLGAPKATPSLKVNTQVPPKLTIRTVPSAPSPSPSVRSTRKRSNAVSSERRSNSFDESETPLDSAKFVGPSSSISSLSSYASDSFRATPRHSSEIKGSRKGFISPEQYNPANSSPSVNGRCYQPSLNCLEEEKRRSQVDPRILAHELGWHNDVVIA